MDNDCIFCRIVSGEVKSDIQDETEDLIIIPDKSPQAPIHLLLVSKAHGEEFANVDSVKLKRMLEKAKEIITTKGLDESSYRILMNGANATVVHNHLHIHLLGSVSHKRPV